MVKADSPLDSATIGQTSSNYAIWEKRQMKVMRKLREGLLSALQSCQLHFDVKASIEEDEEEMGPAERQTNPESALKNIASFEYKTFTDFFIDVVIEPYGARLF